MAYPVPAKGFLQLSPEAAMLSRIVLADSTCFTSVKELLYAAMMRLLSN